MKKASIIWIALLLAFALNGCKKLWFGKDDELSLPRQNYDGKELRTDGYYYNTQDGHYFGIITFFYTNGISFRPNGTFKSLEETDRYILNRLITDHEQGKNKLNWRIFSIKDNKILINYWVPPKPYTSYYYEGEIISDSCFMITKSYRFVNEIKTDELELNSLFYFRRFSPKPDSTNSFIP